MTVRFVVVTVVRTAVEPLAVGFFRENIGRYVEGEAERVERGRGSEGVYSEGERKPEEAVGDENATPRFSSKQRRFSRFSPFCRVCDHAERIWVPMNDFEFRN